MKKFAVTIEGRNFRLGADKEQERLAFYATRYVESDSSEDAGEQALAIVRKDDSLRSNLLNAKGDPPLVCVDEVYELDSFGDAEVPGSGYSFFADDLELQE